MTDDTISRQGAIKAIEEMGFRKTSTVKAILCRLETLPSAQSERKKGRWIDMGDHLMCSCCSATHYGVDKNYCPNCGAEMKGEDDK